MWEIFKSKVKLPRVKFRKLGKEQAWGISTGDLIELDIRLKGKRLLEISAHELYHWQFPELSEEEVIKKSREAAEFFNKLGFKQVTG